MRKLDEPVGLYKKIKADRDGLYIISKFSFKILDIERGIEYPAKLLSADVGRYPTGLVRPLRLAISVIVAQ